MGAPSKRARKVRSDKEFGAAVLAAQLRPPKGSVAIHSWSLSDIYSARQEQMIGRFKRASRLAESMRTDDALFVARTNRLAPQRCTKVELVAAKGARGASIAAEAEALFGADGIGVRPETLVDIHGTLVDHGVAFGYATPITRPDGSRVDYMLEAWPIEHVRWDSIARAFKTLVDGGPEETITHGDGRWIVFRQQEIEPFKNGAILSACLVWARHAFANRDWAKASTAHGNAKVVGEMPLGVKLQEADGGLTTEAAAFLELLKAMANGDVPVGIRPAGSKTDYVVNSSNAWQIWKELSENAEKAAARVYLGTDGMLGAQGGAPGVDIVSLFGVASTLVQGDFGALERGLLTGLIEPWTAINFGDSSLAPKRVYLLPDEDADAARDSIAKRRQAFYADVKAAKESGFAITPDFVAMLAKEYDIEAPPLAALAPSPPAAAAAVTAGPALRAVT